MDRCYSTLVVKSVSDEGTITGIASTPQTDRDGDVMEPLGAEFSLPLPLLWQHDAKQPIGHVVSAVARPDGIHVRAEVSRIAEPGRLKDRLDEAWHAIKHGLVRGLSIGFKGIEATPLGAGRGLHYKRWSWLELSAVTIPSNVAASIVSVKAADVAPGQKPRFHHADLLPSMRSTASIEAQVRKQFSAATLARTASFGDVALMIAAHADATAAVLKDHKRHHARLFQRRREIFDEIHQRVVNIEQRIKALEGRS